MGKTFKRNDRFKSYRKDNGFKKSHKFKEIIKGNNGNDPRQLPPQEKPSYEISGDI